MEAHYSPEVHSLKKTRTLATYSRKGYQMFSSLLLFSRPQLTLALATNFTPIFTLWKEIGNPTMAFHKSTFYFRELHLQQRQQKWCWSKVMSSASFLPALLKCNNRQQFLRNRDEMPNNLPSMLCLMSTEASEASHATGLKQDCTAWRFSLEDKLKCHTFKRRLQLRLTNCWKFESSSSSSSSNWQTKIASVASLFGRIICELCNPPFKRINSQHFPSFLLFSLAFI